MALGHLHSRGYIHRDLKAENVMIEKDGYIKLIDFGLAKFLRPHIKASTRVGTIMYMAPEIFRREHDKNVDWWSLGALMYEMVIGITPF